MRSMTTTFRPKHMLRCRCKKVPLIDLTCFRKHWTNKTPRRLCSQRSLPTERPSYRYSDGRLSIDFFAMALGLPFLSPYLQSVGSDFAHGANYVASGATVLDSTFIAPISLTVQINQFKIFKLQVLSGIGTHGSQGFLPTADSFASGIYMIGGNDFSYGYMILKQSPAQVKRNILPRVARSIAGVVRTLYEEGVRTILVRDVGGKYNYDYSVQCGIGGTINGVAVKAVSCANPPSYVNWDGVHWTDQANRLLTRHILRGKFFGPLFPIRKLCDLRQF